MREIFKHGITAIVAASASVGASAIIAAQSPIGSMAQPERRLALDRSPAPPTPPSSIFSFRCGDGAVVSGNDRAGSLVVGDFSHGDARWCRVVFQTPRPHTEPPKCTVKLNGPGNFTIGRGAIQFAGVVAGETATFSCGD